MNLERYTVWTDNDFLVFEFDSEGPKGVIRKVIEFQQIKAEVYNLAFGDWDKVNSRIDDRGRSNNFDRDKILSTVAYSILLFFKAYPNALVLIQGSANEKTRLNQMGINKYWHVIGDLFEVQGLLSNTWVSFRGGENYRAFLIRPTNN